MEHTTKTKTDEMRQRFGMDDRFGPVTLVSTRDPRRTGVGATKQELCNAIAAVAGVAAPTLREGCTVPRSLFVRVIDVLGLPIDTDQCIVRLARDIALLGDVEWDS